MTPAPNTYQITLSRSDSAVRLRHFRAAPLRLQITSPWALNGVQELRAEIHTQRKLAGQQPLATASAFSPTGYDAVIDFDWERMCLPLRGQNTLSFSLLIRAILADGTPDVYELGTLEIIGNPASDLDPPDVSPQLFASTAALSSATASTTAALALKAPAASPTFTGPARFYGQILFGDVSPSDARVTMLSRSSAVNGFNAWILKSQGGVADVNIDGGAMVHHDHGYALTPGYAGVFQVYALAGGRGTALGCNSFTGLDVSQPYTIPENPEANGNVRFECGPSWPKSEAARYNNGGDYLHGFREIIQFDATQAGNIVTATSGNVFTPVMVGNWLAWSTGSAGKESCVDRIVDYLTPTTVRVERARTIANQRARYGTYGVDLTPAGILRQTGPANQRVLDAHNGADHGAHRVREFARGIVTPDATPAILYGPEVLGDYVQFWEITVTALCDNLNDYAILRRTVQTLRLNGSSQMGPPVVTGTDINTAGLTLSIAFVASQLRLTVTGPGDVSTTWTALCVCTEATVIQPPDT
ncbi:MAG: hypothetical protein V4726_11210 [Verrucomicrobiota bacterium]